MNSPTRIFGGKASALRALSEAGFPVPPWVLVDPNESWDGILKLSGEYFAVRSSAVGEDSAEHSFAGQFDSFLFVPREDIPAKIREVRRSGQSERVLEYRSRNGLTGPPPVPAVIVQEMVAADCAGVAFSADPVGGRRDVAVVSGLWGLGSALVSGEADGDSFYVNREGAILQESTAVKPRAHRAAPGTVEGVAWEAVPVDRQSVPSLTQTQVREIASLARRAEGYFGRPQDIEWAIAGGCLHLLQSRPITSLTGLPDPDDDLCLWDNSNISESYSGVTTPLTFSFAKRIYEHAYREFCALLSVPSARIASGDQIFSGMLGLVSGRIYYNLLNWYRVLAMLPGFQLNRHYMEQMMGVKEPLPDELVQRVLGEIPRASKFREWARILKMAGALARKHRGLPRQIRDFYLRLNSALETPKVRLEEMRLEELIKHYHELESKLLRRWDAPLVNDFFAMIFFGLLRSRCTKWLEDADGTLSNALVRHSGDIVSMEPLRRIDELARLVREDPELLASLQSAISVNVFARWPGFQSELVAYLDKFGDRCLEELKLESATLKDDPRVLFASIAAVASRPVREKEVEPPVEVPKIANPLKRWHFNWVLRHARERVRERENLRFERTRLFGRVRQTMVEIGRRLQADGILGESEDVFYLQLPEILGLASAATTAEALRGIVAERRKVFAGFRGDSPPPDRFTTRGPLHRHKILESTAPKEMVLDGRERKGLGCCAGIVRGRVRVVLDPKEAALQSGEILVARHTDPGWVMLFPLASGLLVERGSLLSHSAIVAREMGLPAVVGLPGLCEWLQSGDEVELDGRLGVVRKCAP